MRLLLVPSWYPRPGAEHLGSFFREQALMLARAGIGVSVLATEAVRVEDPAWLRLPSARIEDGIRVVRLALPSLPPALASLESLLRSRLVARAAGIVEDEGAPDLVHAHTVLPGGASGRVLAKRWGVPLVLTEHRPSSIDSPAFLARARSVEAAVGGAALLTTVSPGFAEALGQRYPGTRWQAVELPVPDLFFDEPRVPREPGASVRFAHVSHVDANKRVVETCRAFLEAFGDSEEASLEIAGGTPEAIAEAEAAIGGPHPSIRFLGRLGRSATARVLARSEVFVLLSAVEAGGTVFSEARAAGCRLLASDTWAGRFAVGGGAGEIVPVDDHGAAVEAMRRLASACAEDASEGLREAARARYSEEAFVRCWGRLYREALEGSGSKGESR